MAKIWFFNEDCFATMKRMEEKGFKYNMIMTSPPYATSRSTVKTQKAIDTYNRRYDICLDNMSDEEYCEWSVKLFNEFDKTLEKDGVILYNVSYGQENPQVLWMMIGDLHRKTNFMVADTIIWKKASALPNNVSANKLTRITEFVFVICRKSEFSTFQCNKKVKTVREDTGQKYYENVFNFIEAKNNDGKCDLNKATYSSELCLKLFDIYAKPDSKVYDPFMGTGTTGIACEMFSDKMQCFGSELSEAQVQYSKNRLQELRTKV